MIEHRRLRIAFAGEVDHGKSTLIGRLMIATNSLSKDKLKEAKKIAKELDQEACLAFLVDQLQEERENLQTIDTTQIFLRTKSRNYALIDNPGHIEFIKNMMTGASGADAAVLVADVSRGVEAQTRRHAYVTKIFGLETLIVAVNKMDLVNYEAGRFQAIEKQLTELFHDLQIGSFCIIPVSAREDANISRNSSRTKWYKGPALIEAMDAIRLKRGLAHCPLRFPVQDVYRINNESVAVGKIAEGLVKKGQEVLVLPSGRRTRVGSIKVFGQRRTKAGSGESIGLTLAHGLDLKRGDIIASRGSHPCPMKNFTADVFWLTGRPLQAGASVTICCTTQKVRCVIEKIKKRIDTATLRTIEEDATELNQNELGNLKIRPIEPLIAETFHASEELGRFVVEERDQLLGAGIITDIGNAA